MYIKKFESFKLRSFKGDNPTSIGKFKVDLLEKFTRLEEEKIKNFVLTHNGSSYKSEKNMIGFWIPYKDMKNKKFIRVEKYHDEWFLVTDYPSYYECDQIDGVIDFLETIVQNKTFENTISFNNKYYVEVDIDEMRDFISSHKYEDFNQDEIIKVGKIFNKSADEIKWETTDGRIVIDLRLRDRSNILLTKFKDELYIAITGLFNSGQNKEGIFICDQFDGLLELLPNLK